jgi:hypothetical protein
MAMTGVDTKTLSGERFGNDGNGDADVDTKCLAGSTIGNDGIGFIRVRKRKLKGGHPQWRAYRTRTGRLVSTSQSFDLVRAVRVNGKPRHQFVLGLGSQKNLDRNHDLGWFWSHAIRKMIRHGFSEDQRQRLIAQMVRKGARLPTIAECENHGRGGAASTQ